MTDHTDVPIVATGDWIDAAWINQYIGDNVRAWRQAYTAGGMIAYALDPNTLAGLAAPAGLSLFQHDGIVPSYLAKGSAGYQYLRMNAAGNAFEFGSTLLTKLGGSGDQSVGANSPVLWAAESVDDGNWHSLVTATSRITVPAAGRYRPACLLGLWTATGGGTASFLTSLRVNGVAAYYNRKATLKDGQMYTTEFPSIPLVLTAGQYVEIYYDSGGIISMDNSYFSLERVP